MKHSVRILRGTSVEYHHEIPSDLQSLTVTPEQKAIFQYLSAVGPDRFQDFVADVLVLTQGHTLVDVTGGPGDEKQDILTTTPDGQRQLTQCKHSINYSAKSSGDELDLMFGAAMRKDCQVALYVTNGDLTPQAKRYINDQEYQRGSKVDPTLFPKLQYWTGRHIWERIAGHAQLLNKWFSGAAQVHGLRSVSVRMITTKMPERDVQDQSPDAVQSAFEGKDGKFALEVGTWFASAHEVPSAAGRLTYNSPVPALKTQISQMAKGTFDVDQGILLAATAALFSVGDADGWIHEHISAPASVLFVHDLERPVMCEVGEARSFVKVGDEIEDELVWCFDPGTGFERDAEDDETWNHTQTGAQWTMSVEQQIGHHEAYGIMLRQQQLAHSAQRYTFWVMENSRRNQELLMSLVTVQGMILERGDSHLLLALPMPDAEAIARQFESYCQRNEVGYRVLDDEEREIVLSNVEEMPIQQSKIVSDIREILTPINLTARFALLVRKIRLSSLSAETLMTFLTYKWTWEQRRGFDPMLGENTVQIGSEELLGRLFDFQTFRGSHMLDIGIGDDESLLYMRRVITTTERASRLALEMLNDLEEVIAALTAIAAHSDSRPS